MLCCVEGREIKYLETFRDIGAVLCGGGGEIKSVLAIVSKKGSLVVSVPACGSSGPSSNLTGSINFISSIKYLEMFRDIRSERREGVAWGVSRNVPRSVSCSFNAYIGTPISNCSYVYSFLAVTFPSISRKVARYLGQCTVTNEISNKS